MPIGAGYLGVVSPDISTCADYAIHNQQFAIGIVRPEGLEPSASWSVAKRSIQLSYGRIIANIKTFSEKVKAFVAHTGFEPVLPT